MPYNLSKKEKYLFYVVGAFISLLVIYKLILVPAMAKSSSLDLQIRAKKKIMENFNKLMSQKDTIQKEADQYAKYEKAKNLTEEEKAASFLKNLEDISKKSGIQIIDLQPYSIKKMDFYTEYRIEIEAESTMHQLVTFIYNIQDSSNLLRVVKMNINNKEDRLDTLKTYLTITKVFIP